MDKKFRLIAKFLGKEANVQELEEFKQSLKKGKAVNLFDQMVKIHYLIALGMKDYDLEKAKKNVRKNIKKDIAKKRVAIYTKLAVAASILLIVAVSFIKSKDWDTQPMDPGTVMTQQIQPGTDKAVLTLENGNQVVLEEGKSYESEKVSGNGKKLVYSKNDGREKPAYNYLTIPRGGQFHVQLPDGSEVWLNSDTQLKYPVSFTNTESRKVELLYGEAFFKVSPSALHDDAPFVVLTKNQEVNVLGTEFNIRAYNDEDIITTTLVEGGVDVATAQGHKKRLKPSQQSRIQKGLGGIDVQVIDVFHEISWRRNLFSFEDESLGRIMKTLSRWYDVEVVFESANDKDFLFTGILERTSSVENILEHIEATGDGEIVCEITNKMIVIK
ncbi:FecR family protein [Flagellimonas onchidii]|uniref:FecR family protein n=1 Tax=Flagellimonas onchidii TaxID=2562684 RepID=UPI0010A5C255|nr:FecR family protein [Allomuricauda onchidii]